jgi:hypothetical protein
MEPINIPSILKSPFNLISPLTTVPDPSRFMEGTSVSFGFDMARNFYQPKIMIF